MLWFKHAQQALASGTPAVLVMVATVRGSAPRAAGAAMLVDAQQAHDTIGGGTLEHRAIDLARALLAQGDRGERAHRGGQAAHVRVPLGPSLGQCCGGLVTLLLTRLGETDHDWLAALAAAGRATGALDLWLHAPPAVPIDAVERGQWPAHRVELSARAPVTARALHVAHLSSTTTPTAAPTTALATAPAPAPAPALVRLRLRDPVLPLVLFGAGHVGRALVQALAPLPIAVTWVDPRADAFPAEVPAHVRIEVTDTPAAEVAAAPTGAAILVMTHLHSLDEELARAALLRGDFSYVGVIGSATKRARFARRLLARGVSAERLAQMQMPIGITMDAPTAGGHAHADPAPATGKEPAVIAALVAAQLLAVRAAWMTAQADPASTRADGAQPPATPTHEDPLGRQPARTVSR